VAASPKADRRPRRHRQAHLIQGDNRSAYGSPNKGQPARRAQAPQLGADDQLTRTGGWSGARQLRGAPAGLRHWREAIKPARQGRRSEWTPPWPSYRSQLPSMKGRVERMPDAVSCPGLGSGRCRPSPPSDQGPGHPQLLLTNCLNCDRPSLPELIGRASADLNPLQPDDIKEEAQASEGRLGSQPLSALSVCASTPWRRSLNGIRVPRQWLESPMAAPSWSFAGYMVGAMGLSALSNFGVIYVLTHDSIGLGEDAPPTRPR